MSWIIRTLTSSVGKKIIMSLTGAFLLVFLATHMAGNLLLFKQDGGKAFNDYAAFMGTSPLIRATEIILALGFLFHIAGGTILTMTAQDARPERYAYSNPGQTSTFSSRNMFITGSIVFIFLVVHLKTFFVPHRITHSSDLSLYHQVAAAFSSPLYVAFYLLAMVVLAVHLHHGFQSCFQTLGINHKKYTPLIKKFGLLYSIAIPAGFAAMPIYFFVISRMQG